MVRKIGIFGLRRGSVFLQIINAIPEQAEVCAVLEYDAKCVEKLKEKKDLGENVKICKDFDELLNSGAEAIILANNFCEHAPYAIKCMENGIAVLSETTAAISLSECIDLCEAYEKTGTKYMLGANMPFCESLLEMKRLNDEGKLGKIMYADAEYYHPMDTKALISSARGKEKHWRSMLPITYYNMHTMGPLMHISGAMPKKVKAIAVRNEELIKSFGISDNYDVTARSMVEMDNGAVFNVTGCSQIGPMSKWFRIDCEKGIVETERYNERIVWSRLNGKVIPDKYFPATYETGFVTKEEYDKYTPGQRNIGHWELDFWLTISFIKFLNDEYKPFFDVYKATALSAVGILGFRSILEDRTIDIPNFADKAEREKYRDDKYSPYAKDEKYVIPYSNK